MKVSKIRLINIRCFKDITIDLTTKKGAFDWSLILGNNGTGKTTILRSLAMSPVQTHFELREIESENRGFLEK